MEKTNLKKIKTRNLDIVFNPAQFRVSYYADEPDIGDAKNKEKKRIESDLYYEVTEGLESDLQNLGIEMTYSAKLMIREIAQNMIIMKRIKQLIICSGVLKTKFEFKKTNTYFRTDMNFHRESKSDFYEQLHNGREVDPLLESYLPKLQKQINEGLKALGLLPVQQIERQKLTIVRKLRQRYEGLAGEFSIEAKKEIKRKMIPQEQSNPKPVEIQDLI